MIITISGMPGSGKSTIADSIAKKLNLKRYSVGDYRREIANKMNISLAELNKKGEKEDWTDKQADKWQTELGKTQDNFVIDGRTGYFFIPDSIKIFLDVDIKVGAERINQRNRKEEQTKTQEEALKIIRQRIKSDIKRYKEYYKTNPYDKSNYDLVIDTTNLSINEVVNKILEFIKLKNQK